MIDERDKRRIINRWVFPTVVLYAVFIGLLVLCIFGFNACSPKIVEKVVTQVEYRDRVVHDTATVEIVREVEKIVTRDTVSHLENRYAMSDAQVSDGYLTHSLASIPQYIKVPVTVHVTDTIIKEAHIAPQVVEVEKPLTWWENFRLRAFLPLLFAVILLLVWTFRKFIF